MPESQTGRSGIDISTENGIVTVSIPAGAELDEDEAESINDEFFDAVREPDVSAALTVLRNENALSGRVFERVKQAAEASHEHGVTRWAVVVDDRVKGMAFSSQIEGIETELFDSMDEAERWLAAA